MERKDIRTAIFSSKTRKTKLLDVFGVQIELRQPSLGAILDMQDVSSTKERIARALISYCFVPGSEERIFDSADVEGIMELPFGADLQAIQDAIAELTGVDIKEAEKN